MQLKPVKKKMIMAFVLISFIGIIFTINSVNAISTCAIDWNHEKQVIDGFGGSGAFHQAANLMTFPERERNQILDLLFLQDKGIGLSIVRNIIGDGGDWGKPIDGPTPSIEPQEGNWQWTGDEDQVWLMNEAQKRSCTRFVSTAWSPPVWMKTNNNVINGGELRPDKYQAFADYLSNYVRGYKEHHNIDIYAISPANEPDYTTAYSSCRWNGTQFRDFIKNYLKPTFKRESVSAKVIMPETMNFNEDYAVDTLNDPEASQGVDIVAAHAYDFKAKPFPVATSQNKAIWQTEVSNIGFNDGSMSDGLKYAKLLHDHMTVTGANAWLFWWLISYKEGESLVHLDTIYKTFTTFKRLYTIGNYSRFVRPGYIRINTDSNPVANVFVTAYKDKLSGKFAIVAINNGNEERNVSFNLNEFPRLDAVIPYRTSNTENLAQLDKIPASNKTFRAALKAKSVTTFIAFQNELPAQLSIREAISSIEAESYDDKSGVKPERGSEEGIAIVFSKKGAFAAYRNINFSNGTAVCDLRIADIYGGGKLELLLDSSMGTPIAKYNIPTTEKKSSSAKTVWKTLSIPTERVRGVHDLYLVFTPWDTGTICKLNWLQFKGAVIPPSGKIKIQMANETAALKTDNIRPHFKIVNTGSIPVKLEEVKIRYFYTLDSETPQQFGYSGGSMPQSTVIGTFVKMNSLTPKSNYYLEIGFTAAAGVLDPGKDVELHVLLATKGTAYRQENDFSFNSKQDVMADWEGAAGYIGGKLCWGNEPSLLINPGFEDGSVAGWFNFGGPSKIMVTDETSQTGAYCLLITNRSESWQGLAQDLMAVMKPGLKYEVSAWIKLKNKAGDAGRVSIKKTDNKGDNYTWVDSKAVSDRDWTHISGFYELKVTGTLKALQLYTEGPEPGVEYYVDNVVVREVPVSNQEAK
jgi:glucuronoarabinoxylan endo-1,4-beta-xylanase